MQPPTVVYYHGIQPSYAVGDAATVTVTDADLNTDSSLVEVYNYTGSGGTPNSETVDFTTGTDIFAVHL